MSTKRQVPQIGQLDGLFILHPSFVGVADRLKFEIEFAKQLSEPPNFLITGPSGVGKTTLRKYLASQYPRTPDACQVDLGRGLYGVCDEIPAVSISLPKQPTANSIARLLLCELGDPRAKSGNGDELTERVTTYLRHCGSRVIFVDETQRAVDRDGVVRRHDIAELLKDLHEKAQVSICLFGLGRSKFLFDEEQLVRRWDNEIPLTPYRWADPNKANGISDDALSFMAVLQSYASELPISFHGDIDITKAETAQRFYFVTRGVIGYLKKLLIAATKVATYRQLSSISYQVLSQALAEAFMNAEYDPSAAGDPFVMHWDARMPPPLPDHTRLLERPSGSGRRGTRKERRHKAMGALTKAA